MPGPVAVVVLVAGLTACNAPSYKGMPIQEFVEIAEAEAAAEQPAGIPGPATTRPAAIPTEYTLGPADLVSVTIYGLDSLDQPTVVPVRISDDGKLVLPLVGPLNVGGQTLTQAERTIAGAYAPRYLKNPRVLLELKQPHTTKVLVIGPTGAAREVELRRNERTIFQSLARGQLGDRAQADLIFVQPASDPHKLETYDLTKASDVVQAMNRPPLEEGDIVIARPAPPPLFYIYGLTQRSLYGVGQGLLGAYPIPESGIRLRQAIAAAGGPPTAFDIDKVVLTRRLKDGRDVCVVFKWKKLVVGEEPDVALRPGDVIEIPHTAQTRTEEFIRNALVLRMGVNAVYDPINHLVPARVDVDDDDNGLNIRKLILSDVALRATRRVTSPVLGP